MGITRRTRRQITAEAVDWFLLLQESAAAESDRQGFSEWLLRSPDHVEEYLRVSSSWALINVGTEGPLEAAALVAAAKAQHETDNVVALPSRLGRRVPLPPVRAISGRRWWMALAASLVLGIALGITYLSW